jgi:DNA-binding response OmpR family regulator
LHLISTGGSSGTSVLDRAPDLERRAALRLLPLRDAPTVLIADPDIRTGALLSFALGTEFDVLFATDGEQALRLALIEQPDLVVLDTHTPKLDGYQVTEQIRQNPMTSAIPVILLDTHPERIDTLRGFAAGANDFITKPLDSLELLARIHDALGCGESAC